MNTAHEAIYSLNLIWFENFQTKQFIFYLSFVPDQGNWSAGDNGK